MSKTDYLQRYLDGQYEAVWQEFLALGSNVVEAELLSGQSLQVARETMRRAATNIKTLHDKLVKLEYPFESAGYVEPTLEDATNIAEIEKLGGSLPLSLKVWYEFVGQVNFIGEDLLFKTHRSDQPRPNKVYSDQALLLNSQLNPPDVLSDPLVIMPTEYVLGRIESLVADEEENLYYEVSPTSGSKFHEQDAHEYFIRLPSNAIDDYVIGNYSLGALSFVDYLREHLQWGGFPGLKQVANPPKELLAFLTKDLLPF